MSLVRWEPFNELLSLQNEINKVFNESMINREKTLEKSQGWLPAINVSEDQESYKVSADLPGINKDEIDISVTGNILTLKGHRKEINQEEKSNFFKKEIKYGSFQRQIAFGQEIESEKVKATYKDGVLASTSQK